MHIKDNGLQAFPKTLISIAIASISPQDEKTTANERNLIRSMDRIQTNDDMQSQKINFWSKRWLETHYSF